MPALPDSTQVPPRRRLVVSHRAKIAAVLAATIAILVLVGWIGNVEALKRIMPGLVAMNPITAVAFLLAAACLWLSSSGGKPIHGPAPLRVARCCALLIIAIGAAKLFSIFSGLDLQIDRLLFAARLDVGSTVRNEMAPNTAFNFLLIGCAFLFLHMRNRRVSAWACIFALVSGFEALLAVLGYLYDIKSLYGVGSFIPMALPTAIAFLLLGWGIMCCEARHGFLAMVSGNNAGGVMARRLLPAAILVPAFLGWLRLEGQRAGLYDSEFGVALHTATNMVVFGTIICWNALSLFRSDTKRSSAERRLRRSHAGLEKRVQKRTAELSSANAALLTARDELEGRVRERTAGLAQSEARFRAVVETTSSVIFIKDLQGRYELVNKRFESVFGVTAEDLIGGKNSLFLPPEAAASIAEHDRLVLESGEPGEFEETVPLADGMHTFLSNKVPLRDASGRISGLCGISTDITERVAANQALREAESEANRANRAKSEFLSRMSHELRTPMNAILGFAQLLELDDLNDNQREEVGHILRGGRHLLELINEVLDISRIESGNLSLSPEPVEMGDALRETMSLVQPLAHAREVRLNPWSACAVFVLADRQRLKQVLINVISNAIKYNRLGGSVTVNCETIETQLRISITDTGIGIPAARLQQLFVPFERLGAEQSTVEGTGLGLALAKRLVESMDGTIGVESSAGQGTTFWVEFPLTAAPLLPENALAELLAPAAVARGDSRTVLYIEDNLSNLRLIERLLERRPEVTLLSAAEGLAGLNVAREHRPDLILLDVNLPDIDGHEVLVRLRGDPHCSSIPVIMISADATRGQIDRLRNAGASEYLTKPLDVRVFLDVLDRALASAVAG